MPVRTKGDDLVVEGDADTPAHADSHALVFGAVSARLKVGHHVGGDLLQALVRADQGLDR
jgi:hypothetical protein